MRQLQDITNQKYGKLQVLRRADNVGRKPSWVCRCDCGEVITVLGENLKNAHTQSCGCLKKAVPQLFQPTHGLKQTRLYRIWNGMKSRCHNPNVKCYPRYGSRGIAVCPEWRTSFQAFYDWAMSNGYADNLTIDRKNNDKGYSPDNCRWATRAEQSQNRGCCHAV